MNKKFVVAILILIAVGVFFIWQIRSRNSPDPHYANKTFDSTQKEPANIDTNIKNFQPDTKIETSKTVKPIKQNDTVPSSWKAYANDRMHIAFQYPGSWIKIGEESNGINLKGEVMTRTISFIDSTSQSFFTVTYHLAPYGAEVYKIAVDQYGSLKGSTEKEMKQNTIAGTDAFESFTTMSNDIKGNVYDPPLKLIHIVFPDKQKSGAFNLNFRTPEPNSKNEIARFKHLLSTIKLTD